LVHQKLHRTDRSLTREVLFTKLVRKLARATATLFHDAQVNIEFIHLINVKNPNLLAQVCQKWEPTDT
jgi:hypothetical protein